MNQATLKKYILSSPSNPGIYMFKKDSRTNYLYIGKASNLKSRLNSYLKTEDTRIIKIVKSAQFLKFISTQSEIEALILESQLIKKFRPQFNIVMRDDKQYAFIGFTTEKYPKIFITHQPNSKHQSIEMSSLIGPFTDVEALKITLRYLRCIFPYCTCKQLHNNFCLNYHIDKCPGYCCLKNPELSIKYQALRNYNKNIKVLKNILSGKKESLIKKLEKEMVQLAQRGRLERAIELRDKLYNLKRIFENARIIKNSDILKTRRSELESLLKMQKPIARIEGYDVSNIQGTHATGSMVTFINGQSDKSFYRKFKINIAIHHDRGVLQSNKLPGDTGMLKEVLNRRFNHPEWTFPDLILIDGGKGQVNAAQTCLVALNISIPIIGISKNERHLGHQLIIPGKKSAHWKTIPLSKLSLADKNILLAIDSEAHRFAISYYRKLHQKII